MKPLKDSFALRILILIPFILCFHVDRAHAQNENTIIEEDLFDVSSEKPYWDMSFTFKTQNVFRGLLPSAAPTFSTQAGVIWDDWILGMYGGVGVDGRYRETDFIIVYHKPRFNIHLEYYYNFTEGITDIPTPSGLFDFDRQTTRGLLDLIFNVQLDKAEKWAFTSSTFLWGRDTDIEEITEGDQTYTVRTDQRYSQYLELSYSWPWGKGKGAVHVGGAFSWADPGGEHFYGDRPGFSNIGISFAREFKINDRIKIPVKATAYVNTINEKAYLVLTVNLIQLSGI